MARNVDSGNLFSDDDEPRILLPKSVQLPDRKPKSALEELQEFLNRSKSQQNNRLVNIGRELLPGESSTALDNLAATAPDQLFVPSTTRNANTIELPSLRETLKFAAQENEEFKPGLPSGGVEVLLYLRPPRVAKFFAQHLNPPEKYGITEKLSPVEEDFIRLLDALDAANGKLSELKGIHLDPRSFEPQEKNGRLFPSAFENFTSKILDSLNYEGMKPHRARVFELLNTVFRAYRLNAREVTYLKENLQLREPRNRSTSFFEGLNIPDQDQSGAHLPVELPKFFESCLQFLPKLDSLDSQPARFQIYSLLDQMIIPDSELGFLMEMFHKYKDWKHQLGLQVFFRQRERNPDDKIVQGIEQQREELLERLAGDNQTLFENFAQILKDAENLPLSFDPLDCQFGKVGIEVEGQLFSNNLNRCLPDRWVAHRDIKAFEVTREGTDQGLEFGPEYLIDLYQYAEWASDHEKNIDTLHLHFDRKRHPIPPILHGLQFQGTRSYMRLANELGTWELWGLPAPEGVGGIHATAIAEMIALGCHASQPIKGEIPDLQLRKPIKDWRELVWGHVCTSTDSPEARLAALRLLAHSELKPYNLVCFLNTIDPQSWGTLLESLQSLHDKGQLLTNEEMLLELTSIVTTHEDYADQEEMGMNNAWAYRLPSSTPWLSPALYKHAGPKPMQANHDEVYDLASAYKVLTQQERTARQVYKDILNNVFTDQITVELYIALIQHPTFSGSEIAAFTAYLFDHRIIPPEKLRHVSRHLDENNPKHEPILKYIWGVRQQMDAFDLSRFIHDFPNWIAREHESDLDRLLVPYTEDLTNGQLALNRACLVAYQRLGKDGWKFISEYLQDIPYCESYTKIIEDLTSNPGELAEELTGLVEEAVNDIISGGKRAFSDMDERISATYLSVEGIRRLHKAGVDVAYLTRRGVWEEDIVNRSEDFIQIMYEFPQFYQDDLVKLIRIQKEYFPKRLINSIVKLGHSAHPELRAWVAKQTINSFEPRETAIIQANLNAQLHRNSR